VSRRIIPPVLAGTMMGPPYRVQYVPLHWMDAVVIPTQVPVLYYVQYVLYLLDHQYL
jgi:hypothetical protein